MIDAATGAGFLNDWDLAKYEEDLRNLVPASEPAGISVSHVSLTGTVCS